MSEDFFDQNGELCGVLRQVSGQLRSSLGNIYHALERLAPPETRDEDGAVDMNAALLCQSYYRILRLADNLADAANLGRTGGARLTNQDIVGFCRNLTEQARQPADMLGLELLFRCGKNGQVIAMDGQRLERLMMNLLSNAFKFTPRGGRVTVEVRVGAQWVELIVADTGCGISPELQDTIFDRYLHTQRLDPPPHGLGLGLPICRQIAQEHGGSLLVTSREGEGTTVSVSLPNRREKGPAVELNTRILVYGGFNRTLAELSDALPKEAFTQKYLD